MTRVRWNDKRRERSTAWGAPAAALVAVSLSGCAGWFDTSDVAEGQPPEAFKTALQDRYIENAVEAYQRGDLAAARFHAERSVQAAKGEIAGPFDLSAEFVDEMNPNAQEDHRILSEWLDIAMNADMKALRPEQTARAQAAFDCWVREFQPSGDAVAREECRQRVESTLKALASPIGEAQDLYAQAAVENSQEGLTPQTTAASLASSTAPSSDEIVTGSIAPQASSAGVQEASVQETSAQETTTRQSSATTSLASFDAIVDAARPAEGDIAVFFERSSAEITPEAELSLIGAVEEIAQTGAPVRVTLFSHTAPSSGDIEERRLAEARAEQVQRFLVDRLGDSAEVGLSPFASPRASNSEVDSVTAALDRRVEIRIERTGG